MKFPVIVLKKYSEKPPENFESNSSLGKFTGKTSERILVEFSEKCVSKILKNLSEELMQLLSDELP